MALYSINFGAKQKRKKCKTRPSSSKPTFMSTGTSKSYGLLAPHSYTLSISISLYPVRMLTPFRCGTIAFLLSLFPIQRVNFENQFLFYLISNLDILVYHFNLLEKQNMVSRRHVTFAKCLPLNFMSQHLILSSGGLFLTPITALWVPNSLTENVTRSTLRLKKKKTIASIYRERPVLAKVQGLALDQTWANPIQAQVLAHLFISKSGLVRLTKRAFKPKLLKINGQASGHFQTINNLCS